jgi:Ca-activated chloride channel family protein
MFQGLEAGVREVRRCLEPTRLNHLILLTDGHTYGDEQQCLQLADEAARENIGISAFGIGTGWNDIFLDELASRTGSNSTYIAKPQQIQQLLVERFHALTNMYAEDTVLRWKSAPGITLSYAFRLDPESGPIVLGEELHLGPILQDTNLNVLLEFVVEPAASQASFVTLLDGMLKVTVTGRPTPAPAIRVRMEREAEDAARNDAPPPELMDALSRFTLYRLQERAQAESDAEDFQSATRHLKNLAALLLSQGEKDLAKTALLEAEQTEKMHALSKEGGKAIKYGTRAMLGNVVERRR